MLDQDLESAVLSLEQRFICYLKTAWFYKVGEYTMPLDCIKEWGLHAIVIQAVGNLGLFGLGRLCFYPFFDYP